MKPLEFELTESDLELVGYIQHHLHDSRNMRNTIELPRTEHERLVKAESILNRG